MLKGNEGIEVGAVFVSIWGYEQTNASYYQVVKIIGKTMVGVRPIYSKVVKTTGYMSQEVVPVIDDFKDDKIIRKKISRETGSPSINIKDYQYAKQIFKNEDGNYPTVNTSSYY